MPSKNNGLRRILPEWIWLIPLIAGFSVFAWHAAHYGHWLIDDSGISFAYARNLSAGFGWVAQAGAEPVEGFSNPLWVILFALLYWLDLFDIYSAAKLISHLFVFVGFLGILTLGKRLMPNQSGALATGFALILCSLNPGFVIWSVSGLENPLLFMLVSILAVLCISALKHTGDNVGWGMMAGLVTAGLALTRPDAIIYSLAFPLALINSQSLSLRNKKRLLLTFALSMSLPLLGYLGFRLAYFQDWLPNTYYAKRGTTINGFYDLINMQGPGAEKTVDLATALLPALPLAVPLLIFYIFQMRKTLPPEHQIMRVLLWITVLGYSAYLILPQDWMGEFRFATVIFPFFYFLSAIAVFMATASSSSRVNRTFLPLGILLGVGLSSYTDFRFRAERFINNPVAPLEIVANRYGLWFNALADEYEISRPSLLLPDLGGTLIYSRMRVIDLAGLCDRTIGRMHFHRTDPAGVSKYILDEIKPDFIHIHGGWSTFSGLHGNNDFSKSYIALGDGDYVRRSSLPPSVTDHAIRSRLRDIRPQLLAQKEAKEFPLPH